MRGISVCRTGARLSALLLLLGAHTSLANPVPIDFVGLLSTGSHVVSVDSATVLDERGGFRSYHTPDWGGDTGIVDTFHFLPERYDLPIVITLFLMQDDSALLFPIPDLAFDTWYMIPGAPRQTEVLIGWWTGLEEDRRPSLGRAGLTVGPSIVRANTTIRAEHVPGTDCAFTLFDAVCNRVRTLRTRASRGAATATWNGEDDAGRRLPEGVYYCRYAAADAIAVRKIIVAH